MDLKRKPPNKATEYPDAQGAIDDTLDAWLPHLIETNERLIAVLTRIRELCRTGMPTDSEAILTEVETALEEVTKTRNQI